MRVCVLLSGGIDSTTCLGLAVDKYGAQNVETLNIVYGQKHDKEIQNAKLIADYYNVNYTLIDISEIMKYSDCSLLQHSDKDIKHESYAEQLSKMGGEGTVDTYVPFRNGLMLSVATSFAISKNCDLIFYGAHADDSAGRAYPDCTPEFSQAMNTAIYEGSGKTVKMVAPLLNWTKSEIVGFGLKHNVPYSLTWSCYEGGEYACGTCATCIDRLKAFEANGTVDPIKYKEGN